MIELNDKSAAAVWNAITPGSEVDMCSSPCRIVFLRDSHGASSIVFVFHDQLNIKLSESTGFEVDLAIQDGSTTLTIKYLLQKEDEGLFYTFSGDLFQLAQSCEGLSQMDCAQAVVERISAWQAFMKTTSRGLSSQSELGLYGELLVLRRILESAGPLETLRGIWNGPLHGAHDFSLSNGRAIEVKTTLGDNPLRVKIDSIVQLDTSDCDRLLLVVVKLREEESGMNLEELRLSVRELLKSRTLQLDFDSLVLSLGYRSENPGRELRRFSEEYMTSYFAESLPRIVPGSIRGVVSARYEIQITDEQGGSDENYKQADLEQYLKE